jgi:hypothetical protein
MMDWLNRSERGKKRQKRRWRMLGLLLLGIALAVYWFDQKTSNAFEAAPNLDLRRPAASPSTPDQRAAATTTTAGASQPAPTNVARAEAGGGVTSMSREEPQEPNTAEEDETIVQGETGQLNLAVNDSETATAAVGAENGPDDQHVETSPIPTITGGVIEGNGTHDCPDGYPIKGNASSRIYHLPGESSYDATVPEVCFATEEDAAAGGYRPRKHYLKSETETGQSPTVSQKASSATAMCPVPVAN